MKKILIACAAVLFVFAACKKDDNNNQKSRSEHLKAAKWFLKAETEREQGVGIDTTYNYMPDYDACELDNYFIFGNDTVTYDNGLTKCDNNEPQVIATAGWKFIDNDSKLVYSFVGGNDTINVSILDATTLQFTDIDSSNGSKYTYIQTYEHQP